MQCHACLFRRPNCEKMYLFFEKKIESVSLMVWKYPRNKAELLLLKLIHLFAQVVLVMEMLEIEATKTT